MLFPHIRQPSVLSRLSPPLHRPRIFPCPAPPLSHQTPVPKYTHTYAIVSLLLELLQHTYSTVQLNQQSSISSFLIRQMRVPHSHSSLLPLQFSLPLLSIPTDRHCITFHWYTYIAYAHIRTYIHIYIKYITSLPRRPCLSLGSSSGLRMFVRFLPRHTVSHHILP